VSEGEKTFQKIFQASKNTKVREKIIASANFLQKLAA
jgi:uncharacterized protein YfaA (DUF2138 family)